MGYTIRQQIVAEGYGKYRGMFQMCWNLYQLYHTKNNHEAPIYHRL